MLRFRSLRAAGALVFAGCAPAAGGPSGATTSAGPAPAIADARLRSTLTEFASDAFLGREAGTPGAERAVAFLAARLAEYGVEPAGDTGFLQRVPVVSRWLTDSTRFRIAAPEGTTVIEPGSALMPLTSLGEGAPLPLIDASAPMVFAGYGLSRPDLRREDFAGLTLQDRVVVVVNGAPPGVDDSTRAELESEESLSPRLIRIVAGRPAAVIILLTGKAAENFKLAVPGMMKGMWLASQAPDAGLPRLLPMLLLGVLPDSGSPLLPAGWPSDDRAQPLSGRTFTGHVDERRAADTVHNVVGIVRGRDSRYRDSYIAYGAHLDHLGVVEPVNGDSIANGADDDGSGSMALLEIARVAAASSSRPRRSQLFVWHTAEEHGLLGSEYFTAHPTVPRDSIVAMINADMIGRNRGDTVHVVGPNAAPNAQGQVLGAIADSINARSARPLIFDRTWDDPQHPERIYERSDHYSYAKHGIPVLFFTGPQHEDYHRVSDEAAKIHFESLERIASLMARIGEAVANRTSRPR